MNKTFQNIIVMGVALVAARYVYKKVLSKSAIAGAYEGEMEACEEMASTMRFQSQRDKEAWIANCYKSDQSKEALETKPELIISDGGIHGAFHKCKETANSMRFASIDAKEAFIMDCVMKSGGA